MTPRRRYLLSALAAALLAAAAAWGLVRWIDAAVAEAAGGWWE